MMLHDLSSQKKKQARQAAMMLRNLSSREGAIHRIVASPFLRCLQVFPFHPPPLLYPFLSMS